MATETELYNQRPPFTQGLLQEQDLNTIYPPALYEGGTLLFLRDVGPVGTFYSRTAGPPPGLVPQWTPIPVGGALGGSRWPKYVVNVAGQQPDVLYTSVQAAIDDAIADGHGPANPTTVHVFPGDYAENVSLRAGIELLGWGAAQHRGDVPGGGAGISDLTDQPRIIGTTTVSNTAGRLAIRNITFCAVDAVPFTFPNNAVVQLHLTGCIFARATHSTVLSALRLGIGSGAELLCRDCVFVSYAPAGDTEPLVKVAGSGFAEVLFDRCRFVGDTAAQRVLLTGVDATIARSTIAGGIDVEATADLTVLDSQQTVVAQSAVFQSLAGLVRVVGGSIDATDGEGPVDTFAALGGEDPDGSLIVSGTTFYHNRRIAAALLPVTSFLATPHTVRGLGQFFTAADMTPTVLATADDLVACDTTNLLGAVQVTLPLTTQVPFGHRLTVAQPIDGGAGVNVDVVAGGGDTIDSGVVATESIALGERVTFQSDPGNATWWRVA